MDEKQISTTKRVIKKLSALRATLHDDERAILDRMVTGVVSLDVEGHVMIQRPIIDSTQFAASTAAADVAAQAMTQRPAIDAATQAAATAAADVAAQAMTQRPAIDAATQAAATAAADVAAQAMTQRHAPRASINKADSRIIFDDKQQVYRLVS